MENMDVKPEAEMASKKPSKMKAIFAAVIAVVLVLGGVYYFVFGQPEEGPPTLGAPDESLYQGLIQTGKYDFLSFDENDVASWVQPEANSLLLEYANSKEGLHYVASNTEITFQEILDSMNPAETQGQLMIAVYDDGFFMTPNDFYVAGEGSTLTIVPIEELDTVTIDPNHFFIVASDQDIELWGDFYTTDNIQGNFDFCSQNIEGWFPGAFSGDISNEFTVNVEGVEIDCTPDQLWALNKTTFEFEEQDLTAITSLNTLIWAYYETAPTDLIEAKIIDMEMESEGAEAIIEPETTVPPQITDLTVFSATPTSITLTWMAPGDEDIYNPKYSYDLRFSLNNITEENWREAKQVIDEEPESEQTPQGIKIFMTISELSPETSYYFAVKALDADENESNLSNVYKTSTTEEEAPEEGPVVEEEAPEEPEEPEETIPEGTVLEEEIPYTVDETLPGTVVELEPLGSIPEEETSEGIVFEFAPLEVEIWPILDFRYIYNTGGGIIRDDIYADASSDSAATIIGFEVENSGNTYAEITELTLGNTVSEGLYDNENNYTHRVRWRNSTKYINGSLGVYLAVLDKNTSGEVTNIRPIATDTDGDAKFSSSEFTAYERIDPGQTKTFVLRISDLDTFRNHFTDSDIEYLYFAYNIANLKFKDSQNNILTGDDMLTHPGDLPSPGDVTIYKK